MTITMEPTDVKAHYPEGCKECPHFGECHHTCAGTHYVYDIKVKTTLVAHKAYAADCPLRQSRIEGEFPVEAAANKQYGPNLKSFIGSLLTQGYVSVDRTKQLVKELGIDISSGTIQNILTQCAGKVSPAAERIGQNVAKLSVIHCDETGTDVKGKLHWVHCLCNDEWSYCKIHEKRGSQAMEDIGILPSLDHATIIHDFWVPYLNYTDVQHGFCNAHLQRELIYSYEVTSQKWAHDLNNLLSEMCGRQKELRAEGQSSFSEEELNDYNSRYDQLIQEGLKLNTLPERIPGQRGRVKKGKHRSLLERMLKYKQDILRFSYDWSVPFTNNEAERCVRFTKVKEKVSGCFRSETSAENFMDVMSYIGTSRKHGVSTMDALREVFTGTSLKLVTS